MSHNMCLDIIFEVSKAINDFQKLKSVWWSFSLKLLCKYRHLMAKHPTNAKCHLVGISTSNKVNSSYDVKLTLSTHGSVGNV